jgi:hypothetical protein
LAVIGIDVVNLGGWASLVVLGVVCAGLTVWFARIVWRLAGWGRRWTKRHPPLT